MFSFIPGLILSESVDLFHVLVWDLFADLGQVVSGFEPGPLKMTLRARLEGVRSTGQQDNRTCHRSGHLKT